MKSKFDESYSRIMNELNRSSSNNIVLENASIGIDELTKKLIDLNSDHIFDKRDVSIEVNELLKDVDINKIPDDAFVNGLYTFYPKELQNRLWQAALNSSEKPEHGYVKAVNILRAMFNEKCNPAEVIGKALEIAKSNEVNFKSLLSLLEHNGNQFSAVVNGSYDNYAAKCLVAVCAAWPEKSVDGFALAYLASECLNNLLRFVSDDDDWNEGISSVISVFHGYDKLLNIIFENDTAAFGPRSYAFLILIGVLDFDAVKEYIGSKGLKNIANWCKSFVEHCSGKFKLPKSMSEYFA